MRRMSDKYLVFEGCCYFRQRLLLSTFTGKPIKIKNIRENDEDPGLREFEASLLRLLDNLTNGTRIEVSETGTTLVYQPGLLIGGSFQHNCSLKRSLGWFLEPLLILAPFCKKPLNITLRGITNDQLDPSVDVLKLGGLPVLRRFLLNDEGLDLKIIKRGFAPGGGGEIKLTSPVCKMLRPINLTDQGKVQRIRGVAYALRVSPAMANRLVEAAKGVLLKYLPDIYIYSDHYKGANAGKSPGFGICLCAETSTGTFYTSEAMSDPAGSNTELSIPENIGKKAAYLLLEEIYRGGIVDSSSQVIALAGMAFNRRDISKITTGPLSPYSKGFLNHMKLFLDFSYKTEEFYPGEEEEELRMGGTKLQVSCLGIGYSNYSKTVT